MELEFLPSCPYFEAASGGCVLRKHFTFAAPGGSLTKLGVEASKVSRTGGRSHCS